MPCLKVGYAVEGPRDHVVVPILVERLIAHRHPDVAAARSQRRPRRRGQGFLRDLPGLAGALSDERADLVVIVMDAHGRSPTNVMQDPEDAWEKAEASSVAPVFGVATEALEAWLLADEKAISRALGGAHVDRQPAPEALDDPKARLSDLINQVTGGRDALTGAVAEQIAHEASLRRLENRCRSFNHFAVGLRAAVQEWLRVAQA